jgi:hypothetical protein
MNATLTTSTLAGPKKEVVVMGTKASNDLLVFTQARIGHRQRFGQECCDVHEDSGGRRCKRRTSGNQVDGE